jgi:hypothetical protein
MYWQGVSLGGHLAAGQWMQHMDSMLRGGGVSGSDRQSPGCGCVGKGGGVSMGVSDGKTGKGSTWWVHALAGAANWQG